MDADRPVAPGQSPEEARAPRRFPRLAALGALLVVAGMAMSWAGAVYAISDHTDTEYAWGLPVLFAGLATMTVGAGIIVWRAVAWFRRHGPLTAVLAGVGGLGLALLLAVAGAALPVVIGAGVVAAIPAMIGVVLISRGRKGGRS